MELEKQPTPEQGTGGTTAAAPGPQSRSAGAGGGLKHSLKGSGYEKGKALLSPKTMPTPNEMAELPASVRSRVRGGDLGGVRVVRNSTEAAGKGVPGFARGREIHVAPGEFKDPLLLHEVAHVLQQQKGRAAGGEKLPTAPNKLEAEAGAAAAAGFVDYGALSGAPEGEYHFEAFKDLVNKLGVEASAGQFVDANFSLGVAVPQVPGLSVTVSADGSYSQNNKGEKELSIDLGIGVEYSLGKLITVSGQFTESLKLTGQDLGRAFVDALKQSVFYFLKKAKVPEQLAEIHALAVRGPDFWDFAKCLIPIYGDYQKVRLLVVAFGAENIKKAYADFMAFFRNDEAVGFEVSIGVSAGAEMEAGDRSGGISLSATAGLEDVDNKDTQGFVEVGGEGVYRDKNNTVKMNIAKRWREGGVQTLSIGVSSQLSLQRFAGQSDGESLIKDASLALSIIHVARALGNARDGAKVGEIMDLGQAVVALAAKAVGGYSVGLDRLVGLDITAERTNGQWDNVAARFKMMSQVGTGTNRSIDVGAAEVEANVSVGKYFDVSGTLKNVLYGADQGAS